MLLVCYGLLNSQNISTNNREKRLVAGTSPALHNKLQKLHRKRSNIWSMVSFIHNGSERTTWMGYNFKENKKCKIQRNVFKIRTFFLNLKLFLSISTLELYANSLKQLFVWLHLWKNIFSSLSICWQKICGFKCQNITYLQ